MPSTCPRLLDLINCFQDIYILHTVGSQTILSKAEVEESLDIHISGTQLLLLLDQITAAHEANRDLVAQTSQQI